MGRTRLPLRSPGRQGEAGTARELQLGLVRPHARGRGRGDRGWVRPGSDPRSATNRLASGKACALSGPRFLHLWEGSRGPSSVTLTRRTRPKEAPVGTGAEAAPCGSHLRSWPALWLCPARGHWPGGPALSGRSWLIQGGHFTQGHAPTVWPATSPLARAWSVRGRGCGSLDEGVEGELGWPLWDLGPEPVPSSSSCLLAKIKEQEGGPGRRKTDLQPVSSVPLTELLFGLQVPKGALWSIPVWPRRPWNRKVLAPGPATGGLHAFRWLWPQLALETRDRERPFRRGRGLRRV